MPLLLLLSSSQLFLFPLLCLFFLLFFSLGSFLSPLLLCLSLRLLLTWLCFPSLIPLSSAFTSLTSPGGGGGDVGSDTVTVLPENRGWSVFVRGLLHGFSSLCSVPPAVAFGSSSLPTLASLLAPPFPLLWVGGSRVVLYSSCMLGLFLPPVPRPCCLLFFSASGPPLLSCALSESSRPLRGSVTCF